MTFWERMLDARVGSMGNLYHYHPLPEVTRLVSEDGSNREQVRHLPGHGALGPSPVGSLGDRIHLAVRRDRARLQMFWLDLVIWVNLALTMSGAIPLRDPNVLTFLIVNMGSSMTSIVAAKEATFWREALADIVQSVCLGTSLFMLVALLSSASFKAYGAAEYWCIFQALVTITVCLTQMLFLGFLTQAHRGRRSTSFFLLYSEDYKNEVSLIYLTSRERRREALVRGLPHWERCEICVSGQGAAGEDECCPVCSEEAVKDRPLHVMRCPECGGTTCLTCMDKIARQSPRTSRCPLCRHPFWSGAAVDRPRAGEPMVVIRES